MSGPTLYAIGAELDALEDLLTEVGGDVTDADAEAAIDQWLAESKDALRTKLDSYGALIREFEGRAALRKAEADRLRALAATDENNVRRMKDRLRWFFEAHEMTKVETARFKFTLSNNGGATPVEVRVPAETLPDWCRVETLSYRADLDAIRRRLEAGEALEFAALGARGKHVRMR